MGKAVEAGLVVHTLIQLWAVVREVVPVGRSHRQQLGCAGFRAEAGFDIHTVGEVRIVVARQSPVPGFELVEARVCGVELPPGDGSARYSDGCHSGYGVDPAAGTPRGGRLVRSFPRGSLNSRPR